MQAAGVVVDKAPGRFASAHDLRRAYGVSWASRMLPADLMKLMRYSDISTTMKYCAGHGVEVTENAAYAALARINTFVNSQVACVHNTTQADAATAIGSGT